MINARAETISEKPSFRNAFKRRRCLILADGFYEWQKIPNTKVKIPTYIRMKVILPEVDYETWLIPDEIAPQKLTPLLVPFDASLMEAYPVSRFVNSPKNDSPECIRPQ